MHALILTTVLAVSDSGSLGREEAVEARTGPTFGTALLAREDHLRSGYS